MRVYRWNSTVVNSKGKTINEGQLSGSLDFKIPFLINDQFGGVCAKKVHAATPQKATRTKTYWANTTVV